MGLFDNLYENQNYNIGTSLPPAPTGRHPFEELLNLGAGPTPMGATPDLGALIKALNSAHDPVGQAIKEQQAAHINRWANREAAMFGRPMQGTKPAGDTSLIDLLKALTSSRDPVGQAIKDADAARVNRDTVQENAIFGY
jgi:hypothetical protein